MRRSASALTNLPDRTRRVHSRTVASEDAGRTETHRNHPVCGAGFGNRPLRSAPPSRFPLSRRTLRDGTKMLGIVVTRTASARSVSNASLLYSLPRIGRSTPYVRHRSRAVASKGRPFSPPPVAQIAARPGPGNDSGGAQGDLKFLPMKWNPETSELMPVRASSYSNRSLQSDFEWREASPSISASDTASSRVIR